MVVLIGAVFAISDQLLMEIIKYSFLKNRIVILFVKGQIKSRPEGQKNRRRLQARAKRVTVGGGFSDPMVET